MSFRSTTLASQHQFQKLKSSKIFFSLGACLFSTSSLLSSMLSANSNAQQLFPFSRLAYWIAQVSISGICQLLHLLLNCCVHLHLHKIYNTLFARNFSTNLSNLHLIVFADEVFSKCWRSKVLSWSLAQALQCALKFVCPSFADFMDCV